MVGFVPLKPTPVTLTHTTTQSTQSMLKRHYTSQTDPCQFKCKNIKQNQYSGKFQCQLTDD